MAPKRAARLLGAMEESLRSIDGLSGVVLHSCFQMTNLLRTAPLIKQAGINAGAVQADLPMPMVDTRDVAAAAAGYLTTPHFTGWQVRDLLGPREYTHREATAILGAAIGHPNLPYVEWPYDVYRQNLLKAGFSASAADTLVQTWVVVNDGPGNTYPARSAHNTTPTTLEAFARETFAPDFSAA